MRIELISKGYNEGNRLVSVIEKKLSKFDKFFQDEASAKIKLSTVGKDKYTMEITINFAGQLVRSEVTSANMYDNIDLLIPKLERQIAKYRDRLISKQSKKVVPIQVEEEDVVPQEKAGKVVKVKNFDISIITVDEAVEELELLDHDFYVFVNADNNKVSVVYKRHDGDYGLLTPEY